MYAIRFYSGETVRIESKEYRRIKETMAEGLTFMEITARHNLSANEGKNVELVINLNTIMFMGELDDIPKI